MSFYDYNSGGFLGGTFRYTTALPGIYSLNDSASAIPRNNLALWLDASNLNSYPGSGTTWTDISGNGINATLTTTSFNANYGGMINMAGPGYATLGNNFNYDDENFSIIFHFFWNNNALPSTTGDINNWLFNKGTYSTSGYFCIHTQQGQIIFFTSQSGANQTTASYGSVLRPQESHIIAIVRNGASVKLYVNDVDVSTAFGASGTHINPTLNSNNFRIGANVTPTAYTRGQYGFFMIYQRAISADELSTIFDVYRLRYGI